MKTNIWKKTEDLEKIQLKKLRAISTHAYHNVPYYNRLFKSVGLRPEDIKSYEDLLLLPITTKIQFNNEKNDVIAKNINIKKCDIHRTSGSTGMFLDIYFTEKDDLYASASYQRARTENGYIPYKDSLLVTTVVVPQKFSVPQIIRKKIINNLYKSKLSYIHVFDPVNTQIVTLKETSPDVIWGYPSAIKALAEEIEKQEIKNISPRLIFTASEVFYPKTRQYISSVFNCDIFDVYGSHETGCIAWECSQHNGYHINMDTVLVEFLDKNGENVGDGERGRVVVTNFHSFAMPIIRYEIGDIAIPVYEECSCGRGGNLIKCIEGRADDFIRLPNNRNFAPRVFESIMKYIPGISEYQIIQNKEKEISVYIKRKGNIQEISTVQEIINKFKNVLGNDVNINVKIVEYIERQKSGKLRSVISDI